MEVKYGFKTLKEEIQSKIHPRRKKGSKNGGQFFGRRGT